MEHKLHRSVHNNSYGICSTKWRSHVGKNTINEATEKWCDTDSAVQSVSGHINIIILLIYYYGNYVLYKFWCKNGWQKMIMKLIEQFLHVRHI